MVKKYDGTPTEFLERTVTEPDCLRVLAVAEAVQKHPRCIGKLSLSEGLGAALVLDDQKLLGRTMLEAVDRIGPDWCASALVAQRRMRQL